MFLSPASPHPFMRASVCNNQVYVNRGALDAEMYCSTGIPTFVKLSFFLINCFASALLWWISNQSREELEKERKIP